MNLERVFFCVKQNEYGKSELIVIMQNFLRPFLYPINVHHLLKKMFFIILFLF